MLVFITWSTYATLARLAVPDTPISANCTSVSCASCAAWSLRTGMVVCTRHAMQCGKPHIVTDKFSWRAVCASAAQGSLHRGPTHWDKGAKATYAP